MPLPRPRTGETEREFMSRCMGDDSVQEEFSGQEQRVAVCMNQFRKASDEPKAASDAMVTATFSVPVEIKSVETEKRQFTGFASTWDIDLDGDRMAPGCFKKSLNEWSSNGRKRQIPLLNRHQHADVTQHVLGHAVSLEETKDGLLGTWTVADTRAGEDAWRLIKRGSVGALSIGFVPIQRGTEKMIDPATGKARDVRVIKEVKLMEVSLVPFPANEGALIDLASVKEALAARDLSDADRDALVEARKAIDLRLGTVPEEKSNEEEASEPGSGPLGTPPPLTYIEAKLGVLVKQRDAAAAAGDYLRAEQLAARARGVELQLGRKRREYEKMRAEIDALDADLTASREQLESAVATAEYETAGMLKRHIEAVEGRLATKREKYLADTNRPAVLMPDSPTRLRMESQLARLLVRSVE